MKMYRNIRSVGGAAMVMLSLLGSALGGQRPAPRDAVTASVKRAPATKLTRADVRRAGRYDVASIR